VINELTDPDTIASRLNDLCRDALMDLELEELTGEFSVKIRRNDANGDSVNATITSPNSMFRDFRIFNHQGQFGLIAEYDKEIFTDLSDDDIRYKEVPTGAHLTFNAFRGKINIKCTAADLREITQDEFEDFIQGAFNTILKILLRNNPGAFNDVNAKPFSIDISRINIGEASVISRPKPKQAIKPPPSVTCYTPEEIREFAPLSAVIGQKEAKEEILDYITIQTSVDPKVRARWPKIHPNHMLLTGGPGTGKTMIAKAAAREILSTNREIRFLTLEPSALIDKFIGESSKGVKGLFAYLRSIAPVILFIDEIDLLLQSRKRLRTTFVDLEIINGFLMELDGFNSNEGILIIGATNLVESMDEAALRPRRFGKVIELKPPTDNDLREAFENEAEKLPIQLDLPNDFVTNFAAKRVGKWTLATLYGFFSYLSEKLMVLEIRTKTKISTLNTQEFKRYLDTYEQSLSIKAKNNQSNIGFNSQKKS
jgi:hypothetical protein